MYWIAFTLGLFGSLHCLGMCGPIALAISAKSSCSNSNIQEGLIYNSGRVITYSFLGLLFGLFGQSLHMAGFQQGVSVTIGLIMIFSVFVPMKYFGKIQVNTKAYFISNYLKKNCLFY